MNFEKKNHYIQTRYNRIKNHFRFRLGFQQLILRPYNMIVPMGLCLLFIFFWKSRWIIFRINELPAIIHPICRYAVSIAVIGIFLTLLYTYILFLGEITARKDEANIAVVLPANALRNGNHPILISRKKIRGTHISIREFYSNISLKIWQEHQEAISDSLNVHFVSPYIEYGGKRNDNGNRVRLYTIPGKKRIDRGILYDEEL